MASGTKTTNGMKRTMVKKIAMLAMSGITGMGMMSAQDRVEASVSLDLATSYIWRGQELGGVCVQPGASVSYKGFTLGLWGSTGLSSRDDESRDTREFDINLTYTFKGFEIGVTDYWFDDGPGYFKYSSHNTSHIYELGLGYDFGPVKLNWYTNLLGNDGVTDKGKRAYSSYIGACAPFTIAGIDWTVEGGATPWQTDFYNANGFAVINLALGASKTVRVTDSFSFPIGVKAIWNPRDDKAYLVASIGF